MKKKYFYYLIYLIFASSFIVSCSNNADGKDVDKDTSSSKSGLPLIQGTDFSFDIKTLSSDGAELILSNLGDHSISCGEPYSLQVWCADVWGTLENDCDWVGVEYTIPPDAQCSINVSFEKLFGKLPEGRYRLVKEITSDGREGNAVCEFSINGE